MKIGKNELKKILTEQRKHYERYAKILIEDFDSKLKLIAEGVLDLRERIIRVEKEILKIKEDITIMKMDISFIKHELKRRVDREEFEALEKRVILVENKLNRAKIS